MSVDSMNGQHDPLFGDVNRQAYISQMRAVATFAGREELTGEPILTHNSWRHEDVATGLSFDSLAGGTRAEVSATTLFRVHEVAYMSDDESAEVVQATLRRFSGSGDNYQFSAALDKAEGALKLELLDVLVDHELMTGYPTSVISWIKRAGGNTVGTEEHGYDLPFFEKVWELSQHSDVGLRERAELASLMVDESADIIAEKSWETTEGAAASGLWMQRHESLQQEVDDALLAQAQDLINRVVEPGEHTLHMRANDLETRILDRWRAHYEVGDLGYANAKVKDMVEANLHLRFMDALARVEQAEIANTDHSDQGEINKANIAIWTYKELILEPEDPTDLSSRSVANMIAREALPENELAEYAEQAGMLSSRVQALRRLKAPASPEARQMHSKSKLQRIANFILRRS